MVWFTASICWWSDNILRLRPRLNSRFGEKNCLSQNPRWLRIPMINKSSLWVCRCSQNVSYDVPLGRRVESEGNSLQTLPLIRIQKTDSISLCGIWVILTFSSWVLVAVGWITTVSCCTGWWVSYCTGRWVSCCTGRWVSCCTGWWVGRAAGRWVGRTTSRVPRRWIGLVSSTSCWRLRPIRIVNYNKIHQRNY